MTENEIYEKLTSLFRDVFDDDGLVLEASTSPEDIEDWDSLASIELVVAIESSFGIKLTVEDAMSMTSVGAIAETIQRACS